MALLISPLFRKDAWGKQGVKPQAPNGILARCRALSILVIIPDSGPRFNKI